jgi:hypothetical protein
MSRPLSTFFFLLLHVWFNRLPTGSKSFFLPSSLSKASESLVPNHARRHHVLPTCLQAGKNNDDDSFDANLLKGDIVAILVASQLIGLLDSLNDDLFWEHGGFAQPLPIVPHTLGTFVQRTSLGCVCWIIPSFVLSNQATIPSSAKTIVVFVALQLGLTFAINNGSSFELFVVLRDCYFVTIVVVGWRYFYRICNFW